MAERTGAQMIAEERRRQIEVEGFTAEHDAKHCMGELAQAASCYALAANMITRWGSENIELRKMPSWPWAEKRWKPTPDPVGNLVKAGALIAAEIDRILAEREKNNG